MMTAPCKRPDGASATAQKQEAKKRRRKRKEKEKKAKPETTRKKSAGVSGRTRANIIRAARSRGAHERKRGWNGRAARRCRERGHQRREPCAIAVVVLLAGRAPAREKARERRSKARGRFEEGGKDGEALREGAQRENIAGEIARPLFGRPGPTYALTSAHERPGDISS